MDFSGCLAYFSASRFSFAVIQSDVDHFNELMFNFVEYWLGKGE